MSNTRLAGLVQSLGAPLVEKICQSKVLMVGAGGIGCELLKNLIDLDTIDTSNLNRQFLFQKQHVGKPKSVCARSAALRWNPEANLVAYHDDVKHTNFGPAYIQQFDLVLNALDNLSARRHVNRMCLAANVPLVESGTAGYLGQVQVIKKGVSECFECTPTAPPKTFPICTIRSNPSTPIHCIVWSQYVFKRFFGPPDEDADGDEDTLEKSKESHDDFTEEQKKEYEEQQKRLESDKAALDGELAKSYARWLFYKLFHNEVLYLSTLKHLWVDRKPPVPLALKPDQDELRDDIEVTREQNQTTPALIPDQKIWNLQESIKVFLEAATKLHDDDKKEKWDKDIKVHLDFVTAAANIRAAVFHLEFSSRFFVKEKAGSIIPAIATTNAIVAGLIVMKAFRILAGQIEKCRNTWLKKQPTRGMLFVGSVLDPPNSKCYVCGDNFVTVKVDTEKQTLKFFLEEVVLKEWDLRHPLISVTTEGQTKMIYEAPDDDEDSEDVENANAQAAKLLRNVYMGHDSVVYIEDQHSALKITVTIKHQTSFESAERPFEVVGGIVSPVAETTAENKEEDSDDGCFIVQDPDEVAVIETVEAKAPEQGQKRKREDEETGPELKKQKIEQ